MSDNHTYELKLVECTRASFGGVFSGSRLAQKSKAESLDEALEEFKPFITTNDKHLAEHFPEFWEAVKNGVCKTWIVESTRVNLQVSDFLEE